MDIHDLIGGWLGSVATLVAFPLVGLGLHALLVSIMTQVARRTPNEYDESIVRHARGPTRVIFPLVALLLSLPQAGLPAELRGFLSHAVGIGLIASTGWLFIALFSVVDDVVRSRFPVDVENNLAARKIQTQMGVFHRIAETMIGVVTVGVILMTFPSIRHIGDSLLASAGLAGLIVGLAPGPRCPTSSPAFSSPSPSRSASMTS